jgi:hypothetical protein
VRLTLLMVALAMASASAGRAAPAADQTGDAASSLTRVARALVNQPSRLALQARKPDFTVDIRERERFEHLTPPQFEFKREPVPRVAAPGSSTPPLYNLDLLPIARAIARAVTGARRAHAEGSARDEVRREIASYCGALPNGGASIQICATSPAIR